MSEQGKSPPPPGRPLRDAIGRLGAAAAALAKSPPRRRAKAFNQLAVMQTLGKAALGMAANPRGLIDAKRAGISQWGTLLRRAVAGREEDGAPLLALPRSDRRFADPQWSESRWFRTIRDAYLLSGQQMREALAAADKLEPSDKSMAEFLLEQYLNAVAPSNFVLSNPEVLRRTRETRGANLIGGFANLLEDIAAGKGVVRRRAKEEFRKGETIAATPGSVIFRNHLFELIQYAPTTATVHAEPLLYVPPLVNKFYMIDLQPRSSLVRWLVEQGRTVFVISWVNPDESHRDCGVAEYITDGVVEAIGAVRRATSSKTVDLFGFCLGGTLAAITAAYLAALGRAEEVNSTTLLGAMVDFTDMRDWSGLVHEAHLDALDRHLERQGFIESAELQQLFSAIRSNDLIWSSVVNHYLLDREAPSSDLLYWFEDGARIPAAFITSYNRGVVARNQLVDAAGFEVRGVPIDLRAITTPVMIIGLKEDHVSAWTTVYAGSRRFGGPVTFVLGGSGHNAGVINPPAANRHGYWTRPDLPVSADEWLEGADKHPGSWWPHWTSWLAEHGSGDQLSPRRPGSPKLRVLAPAPGTFVNVTH